MKNLNKIIFIIIFICALLIKFNIYAQKLISDPIEYNDFIVKQQQDIGAQIGVLNTIITNPQSTEKLALEQVNIILDITLKSIENTNNLVPLEPDFDFKMNAINLFNLYKKILETSYVTMVKELYSANKDDNKLKKIYDEMILEEKKYDEAYLASQEEFATHYNFKLE